MHTDPPIPFTVIAGWLGAGKTTLLNRLLIETTERIAVIVNDIGEINIDAELIAAAGPEVVELTNGCVCCSIGASLAITLRDLTFRHPRPQRIVLEASGLADPARVARYGDRSVVPLDAVITVVDAADISVRLVDPTYGALARAQIEACDLAIVTKLDTVNNVESSAVFDLVQGICRGPVIAADDTLGWTAAVMAAGPADGWGCNTPTSPADEDTKHQPSPTAPQPSTSPTLTDAATTHQASPTASNSALSANVLSPTKVLSTVWTFDDAVDDIVARLQRVQGLLRAKGFVDTSAGPMLVQAAGSRISVTPTEVGDDHIGQLVVLMREPPP